MILISVVWTCLQVFSSAAVHSCKAEKQWPEPGRGCRSERTEGRPSPRGEDTHRREGQAGRAAEGDRGKAGLSWGTWSVEIQVRLPGMPRSPTWQQRRKPDEFRPCWALQQVSAEEGLELKSAVTLVAMRLIFMCYIDYIELRLKMVFTSDEYSVGPLRLGLWGDEGWSQR